MESRIANLSVKESKAIAEKTEKLCDLAGLDVMIRFVVITKKRSVGLPDWTQTVFTFDAAQTPEYNEDLGFAKGVLWSLCN